MNIVIVERKKVPGFDKDGKPAEIVESIDVEFETHPHELVSSVAKRYAETLERSGRPRPPPGTVFFLADEKAKLPPSQTVEQAVKAGASKFKLEAVLR